MNYPPATQWNGLSITMNTKTNRISQSSALAIPLLIVVFCWAYVLAGAGSGMNIWAMTTSKFPPPMNLPKSSLLWSWDYAAVMLGMWWTMMIAMMLPGGIIRLYKQPLRSMWEGLEFVAGYCGVWFAFSLAAVFMQFTAEKLGYLHPMKMWSISVEFSLVTLIAAGVYQFSPMKKAALRHCNSASLFNGFHYGKHCVLASLPLMLLLFVGGAMNIFWIVGLSTVVIIEKNLAKPQLFNSAVGAALLLLTVKLVVS